VINIENKHRISAHAREEFPKECCGLLVSVQGVEVYVRCKNISATPENDFEIAPEEYALIEDTSEILAIVHSHCNQSAEASDIDLKACEMSGLPWIIFALPTYSWNRIEPAKYRAPLIGRNFQVGVLDCYTLIQDWYAENKGVQLPHFDRSDGWEDRGEDLYLKNFEKLGFKIVEDTKNLLEGDVILMNIGGLVVNHGGIFLKPDYMLHHAAKQLSCRVPYGGFWKKHTRVVVRLDKGNVCAE
jgi:proteasome lid subunit RPN8/RPN11